MRYPCAVSACAVHRNNRRSRWGLIIPTAPRRRKNRLETSSVTNGAVACQREEEKNGKGGKETRLPLREHPSEGGLVLEMESRVGTWNIWRDRRVCRRWMPRSTMRPAEGDASDCILVVGVSRSKMAVAFLSVALLSLFLTFHILYDSAVYSLHAVSAVEGRTVELVSQVRIPNDENACVARRQGRRAVRWIYGRYTRRRLSSSPTPRFTSRARIATCLRPS